MYKLQRQVEEGRVVNLSLGVPVVDAYLRFLGHRCQPNTWLSYGYDLQVFLNTVRKPVLEVTPADILAFIQRQWETPRWQGQGRSGTGPGLCSRTVKRRLTAISGFYEYVRICGSRPEPLGCNAIAFATPVLPGCARAACRSRLSKPRLDTGTPH